MESCLPEVSICVGFGSSSWIEENLHQALIPPVCVCVSMLFLLCSAQADTPYVRWLSATTQQLLWLPARFCVHGYSILICNEALMGEQESHKNHPPTHKSILGSIYKLSCIHASICTPALGGTHSPTRSIDQYILCCISSDWACKQTQHAAQNY